jgi:hypothetical protein
LAAAGLAPPASLAGLNCGQAQTARRTPVPQGVAPGPFRPDRELLKQYEPPDWFQDAGSRRAADVGCITFSKAK